MNVSFDSTFVTRTNSTFSSMSPKSLLRSKRHNRHKKNISIDISKVLSSVEDVYLPNIKNQQQKNGTINRKDSLDINKAICDSRQATELFEVDGNRTPTYVGKEAIKSYYEKFKNLPRHIDKGDHHLSASISYLNQINKMKRVPAPMGLVKWNGLSQRIKLPAYQMGDTYAKAIGRGLKHMCAKELSLSSNNLTPRGANALLSHLHQNLKILDLSNNTLDFACIKKLSLSIDEMLNKIKLINLENCHLKMNSVELLCSALKHSYSIKELNLSKNAIEDKSCYSIADLIRDNDSLKVLYLHWNRIRQLGGTLIMLAIAENPTLKILDLSWNGIGKGMLISPLQNVARPNTAVIKKEDLNRTNPEFSPFFAQTERKGQKGPEPKVEQIRFVDALTEVLNERNLVHLDLSQNGLNYEECEIIQKGLENNHSLYGFHISGNSASIDSKGFIHINNGLYQVQKNIGAFQFERRIKGGRMVIRDRNNDFFKTKCIDNCWICEGWNEILFSINITHEINFPGKNNDAVYVHLEFEDYAPDKLKEDTKGVFSLHRMCPPGFHHFFFSSNGSAFCSSRCSSTLSDFHLDKVEIGADIKSVDLAQLNYIEVQKNKELMTDDYGVRIRKCMPRPTEDEMIEIILERSMPSSWSFPMSIFKDYKPDNEALISRCFDFDWKLIKKPKIKEDELEECGKIFKDNYQTLRETYKFYSAVGKLPGLPSISLNAYTDFVKNKLKILDDKLTIGESDRLFIFVNGKEQTGANSMLSLVRYEFLEILFRLALKKYFESKEVSTATSAVKEMLENHIIPNCGEYDSQAFRDKEYWNERCENAIQAHLDILNTIYKGYGGSHSMPGEKKYMMDDEFLKIFTDAKLITDTFCERDVYICFYLSMMTQIDEIHFTRHMKMSFVEFLEAISRAAFMLNLLPPQVEEEDWSPKRRKTQHLSEKIMNFMPHLLKLTDKQFREKYQPPEKDTYTNLFILSPSSKMQVQIICYINFLKSLRKNKR